MTIEVILRKIYFHPAQLTPSSILSQYELSMMINS